MNAQRSKRELLAHIREKRNVRGGGQQGDRRTRSLADFAKMLEVFDAQTYYRDPGLRYCAE